MLRVRHRNLPGQLYNMVQFEPKPTPITFLGMQYNIYKDCKVMCNTDRHTKELQNFKPSDLTVDLDDNPDLTVVRYKNVYKWQMTGSVLVLYYAFLVLSQNKDGSGYNVIQERHDVGSFRTMGMLKDFCNRYKLRLVD